MAAYADSARLGYEKANKEAPDDAQQHGLLGLSLAFLGRREDATREAEHAVELTPIAKDAQAADRGAEQSLEGLAAGGSDVRSAAGSPAFQALVRGTD